MKIGAAVRYRRVDVEDWFNSMFGVVVIDERNVEMFVGMRDRTFPQEPPLKARSGFQLAR